MAPPSGRVVRRAPFSERVKSWFNIADMLLWLSEELNSRDWEEFDRRWSNSMGIALNLIFIFLRANSTPSSSGDDIFEDYHRKPSGLFASLVCTAKSIPDHQLTIAVIVFTPQPCINGVLLPKRHIYTFADETVPHVSFRREQPSSFSISQTSQG
jgi:hypothetical protein